MNADSNLVFDIGMHRGEDTAFYLAKGFRVLAVEAHPGLCSQARQRFAAEIASGHLTIIDGAISSVDGPVAFYANAHSEWGTTVPAWAQRNATRFSSPVAGEYEVPGIKFDSLLADHGVPYFVKVDIEGADLLCLEGLKGQPVFPVYVSVESDKLSWASLRREFRLLQELGYARFKVVNQRNVRRQIPPWPSREGSYADWKFSESASGLFGDEAPGRWLTARGALLKYRLVFLRYRLYGDYGIVSGPRGVGRFMARLLSKLFGDPSWYDTHAGR